MSAAGLTTARRLPHADARLPYQRGSIVELFARGEQVPKFGIDIVRLSSAHLQSLGVAYLLACFDILLALLWRQFGCALDSTPRTVFKGMP